MELLSAAGWPGTKALELWWECHGRKWGDSTERRAVCDGRSGLHEGRAVSGELRAVLTGPNLPLRISLAAVLGVVGAWRFRMEAWSQLGDSGRTPECEDRRRV